MNSDAIGYSRVLNTRGGGLNIRGVWNISQYIISGGGGS